MATTKKIVLSGILVFFSLIQIFGQKLTPQEIQRQIQGQILAAAPGDTIKLPEGNLPLIRSIYLENASKITILGQGKDKTILSFTKQEEGLEALRIFNSQDIRLEGFSIENSTGDAIKIQNVNGIMLKNVKTGWTKNTFNTNHAHGVFIERSSRILIDNSEAYAATNAGIYCRESRDLIIQSSFLHKNSIGISIVNSSNSEIINNIAKYNSIGIAIYNLPGRLVIGEQSKIQNNEVSENNLKLLSPPTYFNQSFPEGTGMIIMAFEKVSLSENKIVNNKTLGILVSDFLFLKLNGGHPEPIKGTEVISKNMATFQFEENPSYSPVCKDIHIFDNTFYREEQKAFTNHLIGQLLTDYYKKSLPVLAMTHILTDTTKQAPQTLCLVDNRNLTIIELQQKEAIQNPIIDITKYQCNLPPLEPVLIKN